MLKLSQPKDWNNMVKAYCQFPDHWSHLGSRFKTRDLQFYIETENVYKLHGVKDLCWLNELNGEWFPDEWKQFVFASV